MILNNESFTKDEKSKAIKMITHDYNKAVYKFMNVKRRLVNIVANSIL